MFTNRDGSRELVIAIRQLLTTEGEGVVSEVVGLLLGESGELNKEGLKLCLGRILDDYESTRTQEIHRVPKIPPENRMGHDSGRAIDSGRWDPGDGGPDQWVPHIPAEGPDGDPDAGADQHEGSSWDDES